MEQYETIDRLAKLAGLPDDEGLTIESLEMTRLWVETDESELAVDGPQT